MVEGPAIPEQNAIRANRSNPPKEPQRDRLSRPASWGKEGNQTPIQKLRQQLSGLTMSLTMSRHGYPASPAFDGEPGGRPSKAYVDGIKKQIEEVKRQIAGIEQSNR